MNTLIIYDSSFDNTRRIADDISWGMGGNAWVVHVDDDYGQYLRECDMLVVGSPTHGGFPTPPIQDFLRGVTADEIGNMPIAAFDTRVHGRWLKVIGFAADKIARRLEHKGGKLVMPPEGFYVEGKEGPIDVGEEARAKNWGGLLEETARKHVTAKAL